MKRFKNFLIAASVVAVCTTTAFAQSSIEANKELVVTGMKRLFIMRDVTALDQLWSPNYIQHNPAVPNGLDVLKGWVANMKPDFKYEIGMVIAEGNLVMIHGRYSGFGPKPMVAVDIFRVENGKIAEHWDILQEEVTKTASGNPMFTNPQK